jgi:hypothetical protein
MGSLRSDTWLGTKMSTNATAGRNKNPVYVSENSQKSDTTQITVTDHAKLRYRQRVDPVALSPADELRQLWERGHPVQSPQVNEGRARATGDYLVVYKNGEGSPLIVTVLRRRDVQ